ncbi:MAG TPA: sulfatase [Bacteroidales bacterium]|nr:sulfatase [Bacteroidales bacterium]
MLSKIKSRNILSFLALSCLGAGTISAKEKSPNVVLVLMDDLGYGDLSCYGALEYKTPNLDDMAKNGMRFTNYLAPQAVSSASRAGLLTGCYPNRVGISGALFPSSKRGLNPSETTLAELFKQKGYSTAIFGKWHLGDQKEFLPLQQGFDEYFGLPYSNDMWPFNYVGGKAEPNTFQYDCIPLPIISGNQKVGEISTLKDQSLLTRMYTEHAIQFIKKNKEKPFFLYLAHSMPHVPIAASEKFKGKSNAGVYGDVMMEMDWSVGEIIKTLKEEGIESNTLIIFTSDNGPWRNFGNHAGSSGGLREAKQTVFEGGQRIPCIMMWEGHIPEGVVCNKLSSSIDLLPTLAAVCELQLPENKIDGLNILDLLKGNTNVSPRRYFYYYYDENSLKAVRRDEWKLVLPHPSITYEKDIPGKDGLPGKVSKISISLALYNLRQDPSERYDVKELYPEIMEELQKVAEWAREDLGDDLTGIKGKNRRPAGMIKN